MLVSHVLVSSVAAVGIGLGEVIIKALDLASSCTSSVLVESLDVVSGVGRAVFLCCCKSVAIVLKVEHCVGFFASRRRV